MKKTGFTLIELLVVVALVAVIGVGVVVTYSGVVEKAKEQTTIHEMDQIRDSFVKFYVDNEHQLFDGVPDLIRNNRKLPSSDFLRSFKSEAQPRVRDSRLYGILEFFERYGLWFLFRQDIPEPRSINKKAFTFHDYNSLNGSGWQGPYISLGKILPYTEVRGELVPFYTSQNSHSKDAIDLPQLATRYENGIYRIIYFEHLESTTAPKKRLYRRLLLVASPNGSNIASNLQLRVYAGNCRNRGFDIEDQNAFPLDLQTGAVVPVDSARQVYFTELMNLDTWEE